MMNRKILDFISIEKFQHKAALLFQLGILLVCINLYGLLIYINNPNLFTSLSEASLFIATISIPSIWGVTQLFIDAYKKQLSVFNSWLIAYAFYPIMIAVFITNNFSILAIGLIVAALTLLTLSSVWIGIKLAPIKGRYWLYLSALLHLLLVLAFIVGLFHDWYLDNCCTQEAEYLTAANTPFMLFLNRFSMLFTLLFLPVLYYLIHGFCYIMLALSIKKLT